MAIEFQCTHCQSTLRVPDEHRGKQARCPQCQTLNLIEPGSGTPHQAKPESTGNPFSGLPTDAEGISSNQAGADSENPYRPTSAQAIRYRKGHRGGLILALGIISIVCNICLIPGIMAWIMGRADLQEIRQGIMDPEGEGLTQAGMIIGIIMTCLGGLGVVMYFGFAVLAVLAGIQ